MVLGKPTIFMGGTLCQNYDWAGLFSKLLKCGYGKDLKWLPGTKPKTKSKYKAHY